MLNKCDENLVFYVYIYSATSLLMKAICESVNEKMILRIFIRLRYCCVVMNGCNYKPNVAKLWSRDHIQAIIYSNDSKTLTLRLSRWTFITLHALSSLSSLGALALNKNKTAGKFPRSLWWGTYKLHSNKKLWWLCSHFFLWEYFSRRLLPTEEWIFTMHGWERLSDNDQENEKKRDGDLGGCLFYVLRLICGARFTCLTDITELLITTPCVWATGVECNLLYVASWISAYFLGEEKKAATIHVYPLACRSIWFAVFLTC